MADVTISIAAGDTYTLTTDLGNQSGDTNFDNLTIVGEGPSSVFDANGHQIYHDDITGAKTITLRNCTVRNLGAAPAIAGGTASYANADYALYLYFKATSSGSLTVDRVAFDASSGIRVNCANGSTVTQSWTNNDWLANTLVPQNSTPATSLYVFHFWLSGGGGTAVFAGNKVRKGRGAFEAQSARPWLVYNNRITGTRGGCDFINSTAMKVTGNFSHCADGDFADGYGGGTYGSQVANWYTSGCDGSVFAHNVLQGGEWTIRSASGTVRDNVLCDCNSHAWVVGPEANTKIYRNIFAPRYDGGTIDNRGFIQCTSAVAGVEVYSNTFDGGPNQQVGNPLACVIAIPSGMTLASYHSNLAYRITADRYVGTDALVAPNEDENVTGTPARPSSDVNRVTLISRNAWYSVGSTAHYGVGQEDGTTEATFAASDVTANPSFAGPLVNAFPYTDADLLDNGVTVAEVLALYREAYRPTSASYDGTGYGGVDIGAVDYLNGPLYLPRALADAAAKASANTSHYQSFKSRLDADLTALTLHASYQGGVLEYAADFALGYRALKGADDATANSYAYKAMGLLRYGIDGNARGGFGSRVYLGRGNGSTTAFTIPDSTGLAQVNVYLTTISTDAKVRGATSSESYGPDATLGPRVIKVSNTSDGTADYAETTSWKDGGVSGAGDDKIDWSPAGAEPANGATYYVTYYTARDFSSNDGKGATLKTLTTHYTRSGATVTFVTAPTSSQAVLVEYLYTNGSLTNQQSYDGRGRANHRIDSAYTTRNLYNLAVAATWLWEQLPTQLKTDVHDRLLEWYDYLIGTHLTDGNNAYQYTGASNYGAGHWAFMSAVMLLLKGRYASEYSARLTAFTTWRTNKIVSMFAAPSGIQGTLQGGHQEEGWGYGQGGPRALLLSEMALDAEGVTSASSAKTWAGETIQAMLAEQATQDTIYPGGDTQSFPRYYPHKMTWAVCGYATTDTTLRAYADQVCQTYNEALSGQALIYNWIDLACRDPYAYPEDWVDALPLAYKSAGTGHVFARRDWTYASTLIGFKCGNLTSTGHLDNDQGGLCISRGSTDLLPVIHGLTGSGANVTTAWVKSKFGSLVMLDDAGAGLQVYSSAGSGPAQGIWYTLPNGDTIGAYENAAGYTYCSGDYRASYGKNDYTTNLATTLNRAWVYDRTNDYIFVYDRATTSSSAYMKRLQWHFASETYTQAGSTNEVPTVTVSTDAWTAAYAAAKLFGKTYCGSAIATTNSIVNVDGGSVDVRRIGVELVTPATTARFVTVLQSAASGVSSMDASAHVASGDGKVEGAMLGTTVAMFGTAGAVTGGTSYQFTATNGATVTHYVADLTASASYDLTGADQPSATASSAGVLTFTSTGTGSAQTVEVGDYTPPPPAPDLSVAEVTNGETDARGTVALSSTRSYTLTNAGDAALTISGLTIPGTVTQTTSVGPGTVLAASASTTMTLRFDATTSGPVSINSDDADAPYAWTLTATVATGGGGSGGVPATSIGFSPVVGR